MRVSGVRRSWLTPASISVRCWIERRRRTVFVPKSLGPLAAVRQVLSSRLADRLTGRTARRLIPRLEREVAALGRSFGEHSVEVGEGD